MKRLLAIVLLADVLVSQAFCADARSKSGFFVGVELDTSMGTNEDFFTLAEFFGFRNPFSTKDLRAVLGAQKYFTPSFGFDVRVRAGTGRMAFRNYDYDYRLFSTYSSLSGGAEAKILWDFYNDEEDSMGMSFGVRYDYIRATHAFSSKHIPSPPPDDLPLMQKFFTTALAPAIGLHYYMGHHQIAFVYSIGRFIDKIGVVSPPKLFFTSNFSYTYRF